MESETNVVKKPKDWPINDKEEKLERINLAVRDFKDNPGYRTREVVMTLVNDHDFNQTSFMGVIRVTDYEVELINDLYYWATIFAMSCVKTYLYQLVGDTTYIHEHYKRVLNAEGKTIDRSIKAYDDYLHRPLLLYHYAFQKYMLEKNAGFAEQLITLVEGIADLCGNKEEYGDITHSYVSLLNDISYMKGNKRTVFWQFKREELFDLFALEAKLITLSNEDPNRSPLRGVLMTQISNYILKSRNNYNSDYICKYVPNNVALSSILNHQIWMKKTEKLNDENEGKVIPQLFMEDAWIEYPWAKEMNFSNTRIYYTSSFCKKNNSERMKERYGRCIYGYKNDRISELIAPIRMQHMKKRSDVKEPNMQERVDWPRISQVIEFDVLYNKKAAKEELSFLFNIVDLMLGDNSDKKSFLEEILQYWIYSVKEYKWRGERERRYVIFMYENYDYIELEKDDTYLKTKTSIFSLPDFILGDTNPAKYDIRKAILDRIQFISKRGFMFCNNCLNTDYDVINTGSLSKCPICNSPDIVVNNLNLKRL